MKQTLIFSYLLFSFVAMSQEKKAIWDYPVKPGSKEWTQFESNEQMVKACQIPEKILLSLSTDELVDLCLQYPLIYDIFAFNSPNDGLNKFISDFNGIQELYKRKDAIAVMLERYKSKVRNVSYLDGPYKEVDKGYFIMSISAIEILLCSIELHTSNAKELSVEVLRNLVSCYEVKQKYVDYFKGFGFQTNLFSRAHIVSKIDSRMVDRLPQKSKNVTLFSGMADAISMGVVDEYSYKLIK